jgi:hypothetical protein
VPDLDPARGRNVEIDVVDADRHDRHGSKPRRRLEQLRVDTVRQQAEQSVGVPTCGVEVGRGGGQPPRPYLHVVLTSQARQRITRKLAGDEAARQELRSL